jgi:hypothetical protein
LRKTPNSMYGSWFGSDREVEVRRTAGLT